MKPRRDITLGEMQDECKFRGDNCETVGGDRCKFFEVCATMQTIDKGCLTPIMWNLNDPPRFNEAQMAFWRGWYAMGARFVKRRTGTGCVDFSLTTKEFCVSNPCVLPNDIAIQLEEGKVYDLAELFGKDSESK